MTNPRIVNLNAHLICLWWGDLDGLDLEGLACCPGYCCLFVVSLMIIYPVLPILSFQMSLYSRMNEITRLSLGGG